MALVQAGVARVHVQTASRVRKSSLCNTSGDDEPNEWKGELHNKGAQGTKEWKVEVRTKGE